MLILGLQVVTKFIITNIQVEFYLCGMQNLRKKTLQTIEELLGFNLKKSYAYGDTTGDYTMLTSDWFPNSYQPNKNYSKKLRDNKIEL